MIDQKTIEKMAQLARLSINESQAKEYSQQLSQVLKYFEQISEVKTEGVLPLVTPTQIENFWREDVSVRELSAEELTANAPARSGHLLKVPPVV